MPKMKLGEFCDKYCQDILEKHRNTKSMVFSDNLPYDEIVLDESDTPMKVVYSRDRRIPIWDILTADREEFAKVYSTDSDLETYDRYCNSVVLLEGEEVINEIRNKIKKEMDSIRNFKADTVDGLTSIIDE